MNPHRPRRAFLSLAMVWLSFYEQLAWVPILIIFATAVGAPETLAFAASAYSTSNMAGNALFGSFSDRRNRSKVAAIGFFGLTITTVSHLFIAEPAHLITVRFFHGLAAAAIAPAAFASLAEGVPQDKRGEIMARAGLVIALASMISPALNGVLHGTVGMNVTVGVLAGMLALMGAVAYFAPSTAGGTKLPNLSDLSPSASEETTQASPEGEAMDRKLLLLSCAIAFALMFCQNVLFYAFPLKASALNLAAHQTGPLLSFFAIGSVITFVPPLSRLSDRIGRRTPLILGLIITSVALFGLAFVQIPATIALALFTYGTGFGLIFPSLTALNADASGPARRGLGFGLLTAAFSAGSVTGPLVTHGLSSIASPFTTAGVVLITACIVTIGSLPRRQN